MTIDYWRKTNQMKPFNSVEEFEKFEDDLLKLPSLKSFSNSPLGKSKIRKGVNLLSEKFDSFAEYTFVTYMREIKHFIVERNIKTYFLTYIDQNGKICKFYYDFKINGIPSEVKGRLTDKDRCKLEQCPDVKWYFQNEINNMGNELDRIIPNWRTNFIQLN